MQSTCNAASVSLLDELNRLLIENGDRLSIPDFRRTVHRTGENLQWLRKALKRHSDAPERLVELVKLNINELIR